MANQSAYTRFFQLVTKALVIIPMAGLLMAPTCDQSHSGNYGDTSDPVVKYRAFGDSIPSGNLNSGSEHTTSYVNYYANYMAGANDWRVTYQAKTIAGETTSQINSTMNSNTSLMAEADVFTFNAGGNDLLDARSDNGCSDSALTSAMNSWRNAWDNVINTVETYVPSDAVIRTMTIYYPDPDNDRGSSCGQWNKFEMLLPHGLAASDYMCSTAEARGWGCADALSVMNCDEDANGTPDARCPNINYLNVLAATSCPRGSNGMMDASCIRAHLDITDDWAYFRDPTSVSKGGSLRNLVQSGDIHPNQEGHDRIGAAHHDLGYNLGPCVPSCTGALCGQGDGCGGTCASTDANTCGLCGNPGPDCSGDQCGQSDGCGGTCPSTDVNECGMCGNAACETPPGLDEIIAASTGNELHRTFDGTDPTVSMSGGSGDADLYVKLGSAPTTSSYDCRPYKSGNNETCDMTGTGTWHVMVRAYSTYSNVLLESTDGAGGGGGGICENTCQYANDGECDDGGPGSQYSVCGLGTDCGDCGPR